MKAPCDACCGSGERDLTLHERETIAAIGDGWRSTSEIAPLITTPIGIRMPALCNRLARLAEIGLIQRRAVDGKRFEWRRIQQAKAGARKAG